MVLLAKNGVVSVPWNEALHWSAARRLAALIIVGEANGGTFDWTAMQMRWPGRS